MDLTQEEAAHLIAACRALDESEVLIGYMDGFNGAPLDRSSPSYHHGWRNGMIESGRIPADRAYSDLKRAFETSATVNQSDPV